MSLRVVGAGLGRTGTHSLKIALETLLDAPCYHMIETFGKPDHVREWQRGADGGSPDWDVVFHGYAAAVDWPTAAYYRELLDTYADALVLLSVRDDAEAWWISANATIFEALDRVSGDPPDLERMILTMLANRFTPEWRDRDRAIRAYLSHNEQVRTEVPPERLLEYRAGDGWTPLCERLELPVPDIDFPHVNTTVEFRAMTGLDQA